MTRASLLSLSLLLGACASKLSLTQQNELRDAAALDHGCPRDRVELVSESHDPEIGARYQVDVCGRMRKYLIEDGRFVDSTNRARARDRRDAHRESLENPPAEDHAPKEEQQ